MKRGAGVDPAVDVVEAPAAGRPALLEPSARDKLVGIGFIVFGVAAFSMMDAIGKRVAADTPVLTMLAIRSTVSTLLLLLVLPVAGGARVLKTAQPAAHVLRALAGMAAFLFFFTAVRYLPLADAVAIAFGGPFILTALSVPLLGEEVGLRRWLAIGVGFTGMLLIVQPTGEGFRPAALLAIASSVSYALMMIMTRWMSGRGVSQDTNICYVFYTFVVQGLAAWLLASLRWRAVETSTVAWVALMGLLGLAGNYGVTVAFRKAPVAVVAPFEYTTLIWAVTLGYLVFGDFPGLWVWLGVFVIVLAGLYTLRQESD